MLIYDPFPRSPTTAQRGNPCAHTRVEHPINPIYINHNAPSRKLVKVGRGKRAKLVRRIVFK